MFKVGSKRPVPTDCEAKASSDATSSPERHHQCTAQTNHAELDAHHTRTDRNAVWAGGTRTKSCISGDHLFEGHYTTKSNWTSLLHQSRSDPLKLQQIVTEFEQCRLVLRRTFENIPGYQFTYVCYAISCILRFRSPQHVSAISIAIALVVEYRFPQQSLALHKLLEEDEWMLHCQTIVQTDADGLVFFRSMAMPFFLTRFEIEGLDTSHETIAMACLICTKLNSNGVEENLVDFGGSKPKSTSFSFARYASENWRYHVERAGGMLEQFNEQEWPTMKFAKSRIGPPEVLPRYQRTSVDVHQSLTALSNEASQMKLEDEAWVVLDSLDD